MLTTQFLYQQNAHFILCNSVDKNFNITICKNFMGLQRSIGPKKKKGAISSNFELKKFKKQPDQKKFIYRIVVIGQFYLKISLEEFWSFIQIVLIATSPIYRCPPA